MTCQRMIYFDKRGVGRLFGNRLAIPWVRLLPVSCDGTDEKSYDIRIVIVKRRPEIILWKLFKGVNNIL